MRYFYFGKGNRRYFFRGKPNQMKYHYQQGKPDHPVLMLLHGTGGNEYDLIPTTNLIDPDATILSFRGDVNEFGNLRFFKRHTNGAFDIDDLKMRTDKLHSYIYQLAQKLKFNVEDIIALGYSNGANMIGSLLIGKQIPFKGAILMHPILSRRDIIPNDLSKTKILITAGTNDPLCPVGETKKLIDVLKNANADVTVKWFEFGHRLTVEEITEAETWYQNNKKSK